MTAAPATTSGQPAAKPAPIPPPVAWRGLLATGVGAVLAGLSSQAHGLAQADLGGGFGVSADDASWISTAGTAAEAPAVLITAFLVAAFGIRRVMVVAAVIANAAAAAVLFAPVAGSAIPLRALEGFAAGLLPVVMMAWALRAFPPARRGLPLMLFAFCSSIPSAFAALVSGTATSLFGGRGVFVFDLCWTVPVLLLALLLAPREPMQPRRLLAVDWIGYVLFAGGLVLTLVLLSQGERRFWLETTWIAPLLAGAVALVSFALGWLLVAKAPLLNLTLLGRSTFALGLSEAFSLRFALLIASFAIPQALGRLHGLRPEQAGAAILWLAAGQGIGFPAAYLWIRRRDARWTLGLGLALFAVAALAAALIDPAWQGDQFRACLVLAGLGQGFYLTSVMTFATYGVPPEAGPTAAGLFNVTRVIGTAGATAAVSYWLRIRENFHSAQLVDNLTVSNSAAVGRLKALTATYSRVTSDAGAASGRALASLAGSVTGQAYTLAFADVFLSVAAVLACFALVVPLLPYLPPFSEPKSA